MLDWNDICMPIAGNSGIAVISALPRLSITNSRTPATSRSGIGMLPIMGFDIEPSRFATVPVTRRPTGSVANSRTRVARVEIVVGTSPPGMLAMFTMVSTEW